MEGNPTHVKWTEARFVPEDRKGLHKPNSVEWMVMVTGVAICSMGGLAIPIGAAIALGTAYSGFFVQPKVKRGIYLGKCPHCGAVMSATHYQQELGCPSCNRLVKVRNGRYEAD